MDENLYRLVHTKFPKITRNQCIIAKNNNTEADEYDTSKGHELTLCYKMISLYTSNLHAAIPEFVSMWNIGNKFYVRTTEHMFAATSSFESILIGARKHLILSFLMEIGTAINILHGLGISHGYLHENAVLVNDNKQCSIMLSTCSIINSNQTLDFQQEKRKDIAAFARMIRRIMIKTRIDLSSAMSTESIHDSVRALRKCIIDDMIAYESGFWSWQQQTFFNLLTTHEFMYANVNMKTPKDMMDSVVGVFVGIFNNNSVNENGKFVLPVFVERCKPQRGLSASFNIIHALFDELTEKGYLVKNTQGMLIPNKNRLMVQSEKKKFALIGYLLAYVFVIQAPINCLFSKLVVDIVMNTSLGPMNFINSVEKQELSECKEQLCFMRLGARRITDHFPISEHYKSIYDYFYNTQHAQTVIPDLSISNFAFDRDFTADEQFMMMKYIRSLTLEKEKAMAFTRFVANSDYVCKSASTVVTLRKTCEYPGIKVSTCECSITIPQAWLSDQQILQENMDMQLMPDAREKSSNEEKMSFSYNAI